MGQVDADNLGPVGGRKAPWGCRPCSPADWNASAALCTNARNLGIDPSVSEIGTEGDLQACDPVFEPRRIVGGRGLQTGVIPRMGARHRLEHQGGVGHRPGHRPHVGNLVVVRHRPVGHPAKGWFDAKRAAEVRGAYGSSPRRPSPW